MNLLNYNINHFLHSGWRVVAVLLLMFFMAVPALAQNAKGDKPVGNKGKLRETRFKTRSREGDRPRTKDIAGKRIRQKNKSSAQRAVVHYKTPKGAKASNRGDSDRVGRPISPIAGTRPRDSQKAWKGGPGGKRINVRSSTGRTRNVFPQFGRYNRNPSRTPRMNQNAVSNRAQLARLKRQQRDPENPDKGRKIVPRSASRAYISRRSVNPMSGFSRHKRKSGDRPYQGDIAGKPLRQKNYQTPRPGVVSPTFKAYYGRKRVGDKPYRGPAAGKHITSTKPRQRVWRGDIAGRKIRGKNYSSDVNTGSNVRFLNGRPAKPKVGDRPVRGRYPGGGYRSATQRPEKRTGKAALPVRAPGKGAVGMAKYEGRIKGRAPLKGGGSVSGRLWNNDGRAVAVRTPSSEAAKAGKFSGNIKRGRPQKGGGSVSGKLWNNREKPIAVRTPTTEAAKAGRFSGNIKRGRPEKGGGSVSGRLWNNDEQPIAVRTPSSRAAKAGKFAGNIRSGGRPLKGGGSVSGKLWNNDETPIKVRTPQTVAAYKAGTYQGDLKRFEATPGMSDQGEEYTGHIRLSRFRKSYIRNANASKEAMLKARPSKNSYKVDDLQVKVKQYRYVHNKSSADDALKVREPGKAFITASSYQGNIKMKKFDLFDKSDLHPDAKFVKTNKNNVAEEKDLTTNFKLWWSRLFRKNETQPEHLKKKEGKPRYDKGEQGLWYD